MRTHTICLALAIVLLCPFASAQWIQIGGGSPVTSFAAVGSSIFAGTSGAGIFYSTDSGSHWLPTASSPADPSVRSLIAMDTTLFALTDSLGVFLSRDKGQHWIAVNNGLPNAGGLFLTLNGAISILGTKVFLHGYEGTTYPPTYVGFYCSTDQGAHWGRTGSDITPNNNGLLCLGAFGTILFAGAGGGNPNGGFFLSTNSGASWVSANNGMRDQYGNSPTVYCCTEKDDNLFVGTYNGVYRSIDSGNTWMAVNTGLPDGYIDARSISCLTFQGADLFAGTFTGGVYHSTDNGSTWMGTNAGLMGKDIASLCGSGTNIIAGTGCGVFYSSNNGAVWSAAFGMDAIVSGTVLSLLLRGNEVFVSTDRSIGRSLRAGNTFRSANHGTSWVALTDLRLRALATNGTDLFGLTYSGVVRSTDDGQTWTVRNAGLPVYPYDSSYVSASAIVPYGQHLFAGTLDGVYWSTDEGASWSARNDGLKNQPISRMLLAGSTFYAGSDTNGVFRTTDEGATWTHIRAGLPRLSDGEPSWILCMASTGDDVFAATGYGVYQLKGSDSVWTEIVSPAGIGGLVSSGHTLVAWDGGIFSRNSQGGSWSTVNEYGLPDPPSFILSMWTDNEYAYASPGYGNAAFDWGVGLWRRPLSEIVTAAHVDKRPAPVEFHLGQNYPNPFNPSTTIKFELPRASQVSLTVFDILGREVSVLVNDRRDAGVYEVKFDGSALASGVYFYRIHAGDYAATKKLILMK